MKARILLFIAILLTSQIMQGQFTVLSATSDGNCDCSGTLLSSPAGIDWVSSTSASPLTYCTPTTFVGFTCLNYNSTLGRWEINAFLCDALDPIFVNSAASSAVEPPCDGWTINPEYGGITDGCTGFMIQPASGPPWGSVDCTIGMCFPGTCSGGTASAELSKFDLKQISDLQVLLRWETRFEENLEGFSIERSIDFIEWETIEFIDSKQSQDINSYHHIDQVYGAETHYYRLKVLDHNGSFYYSQVMSIDIKEKQKGDDQLVVYPNPNSGDILHILLPHSAASSIGKAKVSILASDGGLIGVNTHTVSSYLGVEVADLVHGIYWLKIDNGIDSWQTKFVRL